MTDDELRRALEAERKAHRRARIQGAKAEERAARWRERYLATERALKATQAARERDIRRLAAKIAQVERRWL